MINIGITGHQRINGQGSWQWVKKILCNKLNMIPDTIIGISSLAIGADQLFTSLVLERKGKIYAIIPFEGYDRTFSKLNLHKYHRIISQASTVEIMQTKGTNEDAYLAAGKRIVDLADLMFAVWDGKPAKGKGGTSDIVEYAMNKKIKIVHINPISRTVTSK